MISENMYNRICSVFFEEDLRLSNKVIECENYIIKYRPIDPEPYLRLLQAQTEKTYFDKYIFTLLPWLNKFVK